YWKATYRDLSASTVDVIYRYCYETYGARVQKEFNELLPDDGEQAPAPETIAGIVKLIEKLSRTESLPEPEVSFFYGEAMVTWRCNKREVSLLSRGNADDPKIMKYEKQLNEPSFHHVDNNANEHDLKN